MIYVVGPTERVGPVKIGYSDRSVKRRLQEHQVGSPSMLGVVCEFQGGRAEERGLHLAFKDFNTHGEWFSFTDTIREWLNGRTLTRGFNSGELWEMYVGHLICGCEGLCGIRANPKTTEGIRHRWALEVADLSTVQR